MHPLLEVLRTAVTIVVLTIRVQWRRLMRWVDDQVPCERCESDLICSDHQRRCNYCGCVIEIADGTHYVYRDQYWCSASCFYSEERIRW